LDTDVIVIAIYDTPLSPWWRKQSKEYGKFDVFLKNDFVVCN